MIECAFCDSEGIKWDTDLEMALCLGHYDEMNGTCLEVTLAESEWDM